MQSAPSHVQQGGAPPGPPPMQSVGSGSVNGNDNNSMGPTHGQVAAAQMQHTQYQPNQYQHQPPPQHQQQQQHHHAPAPPPPSQQHQQPPPHQQQHHPQQHQQHQQQHHPPPHQQHQQHHQQQHQQHHAPAPPPQHQQQQHHQQPPPQHQQQQQGPPPQQQYQQGPPPQQRNSYTQQPMQQQPGQPQQGPPQQQPPPQHHYPHQGLNGGWQSDKDYQERRKMIAKIVHLLQQRKPNAPQEWLKKLPQMAKRLEESLYRSAKSFEQYNDATTLKHRLQQLAVNIGMKTKKMQQQGGQVQQQKVPQQQPQQQPPPHQYQQQQQQQQQPPPNQYRPPPTQQPQQQMHRPPSQGPPVQARAPAPQPIQQRQQQPLQQQPQVQQAPQPQQQQQRMVNMAEINPIMGGPPPQNQPPPQQVQPSSQPPPGAPPQHQPIQYQPQPASAPLPVAPAGPQPPAPGQNGARPPSAGAASRQVSDRQQVLRHQQQRLLLLRHAAKCQHEDGRCPVTPHCAGMKRLWKHIAECKDQKCLVPHCVSSRYVLSHYHRCKDVRCPVCGPVREAIHRSHEKQKQMQALKQRHQQAVQQTQIQAAPASSSGAPAPVAPAAPLPPQPMSSGPIGPPIGHTSIAPVGSSGPEPPNKRQKTGIVHQQYQQPQPHPGAPAMPQQPIPQPSSTGPGMAPQPPGAAPGQYQQYPPQPGAPAPIQAVPGAVPVPGAQPGAPGAPGARPAITTAPGIAFANGQVITPKYTGPKPQEDHTLINCFSVDQIETHIASLNKGLQLPPQKLKTKCLEVLKILQSHQHGWVFNSPVDPVELGLPDYFEVIKRPMDLGTIRKKLENGCYHTLEDFEEHVNLTFENAMLYNPQGSVVYNMAEEMKNKFAEDYQQLMRVLNAEEDAKRKNGEACVLCGCEKLLFEPPVFYCNGLNCPSKRIRRNSYYYVGGNNQYHWCHQCFQELKDNQTIELADITIKKETLLKKKNDEVHEESWVQCDRCERWIHQICALFNTRQNKDQRSEYACPRCTIAERRKKGELEATSETPMAEDLPRTKLSEYLEDHVRTKMSEYIETNAKAKSEKEQMPIEEARKSLEMGGHITIRQVTSMDRKLEVRERMKRRYAFKNYPDEFNFRCKCIVVFQNLDGVDVILFGLYVYEHDENNPDPNKRTVYVSYLDSVHYMRPRKMRTFIYHEILISYLDYVRKKGFSTAHIWACPPLKGDDYILYAKPEDQKVPRDDRLRQWYIDMLIESQRRGIVGTITNMYDLYFANEKNDATVVPYMDGDYFPAEVENIIKDIEEGKTGKKGSSQGKKKKGSNNKAKQKKKNGRGGTRSTGLDEEALKKSGFLPPGSDGKSIEEGGRDYVMTKLGETIQPMKESFIVAYLAWEGAKRENMIVPKEIEAYRKEHGIVAFMGKDDDAPAEEEKEKASETPAAEGAKAQSEKESAKEPEEKKDSNDTSNGDVKMEESADAAKEKGEGAAEPADKASNGDKPQPSEDAKKDGAKGAEEPKPEEKTEEKPEEKPDEKSDEKKSEEKPDEKSEEKPDEKSEEKSEEKPDEPMPDADATPAVKEETKDGDGDGDGDDKKGDDQKEKGDTAAAEGTEESKEESKEETKEEDSPAAADADAPAPSEDPPKETSEPMKTEDEAEATTAPAPAPEGSAEPAPAPTGEGDTSKDAAATAPASAPGPAADSATEAPAPAPESASGSGDDSQKPAAQSAMAIRKGKFAAMAAKKRDVDGSPKPEEEEKEKDKEPEKKKKEAETIYVKDSRGRTVKVIDDDDEEMDCEFLNNRQAFLNLCQGNHYQFDYLRRAKHSSMMVLWHLHNRDAPKFVQQCATCSREILTGYRFHCPTCADFDQCQDCVQNPKVARHPHQLKPIPVASGQQPELTAEQRKERQRSIQLHMTLLQHAATCNNPKCPSANCTKMKGLLKHGAQCQIKATGGCNVCKRIWALLQIHARQCRASSCPVPNCMAIRERVRQLKKQQQAMDDRRRQEMNRAYARMN